MKVHTMKSYPSFILLIFWISPVIAQYSQNQITDFPVNVIFPDSGYAVIDGRNASAGQYGYIVTSLLKAPEQEPDKHFFPVEKKKAGVFIEKKNSALTSMAGLSPREQYYRLMEEFGSETGINNPVEQFKITGISMDELGITHVRAVQQYEGIEVYGSESILHIDSEKNRLIGTIHPSIKNVNKTPDIGSETACETAKSQLQKMLHWKEMSVSQKKLLKYDGPTAALIIYPEDDGKYSLAWLVTLRPNFMEEWKFFINATDGSIIRSYNNTQYDGPVVATGNDLNNMTRTFNVYLSGGIFYLYDITQHMFNPSTNEGIIITLDANNTSPQNLDYSYITSVDNNWTQQAAISAHCNAVKTYQYFDTTFNRNSINGKGCNIISLVNVVQDDGTAMDNAFWNGQAVYYGNGGPNFKPLAGALDVTAHEITHGIISSTANLEYYGQPGSVSESLADIFACMVDRFDWTIGEDVTKEGYSPGNVIRNLADPHNGGDSSNVYWQPAHTSEMYLGTDDNGGVHKNSGICNYAFYKFASNIGRKDAEQVYYRALTEYLTKNSGFIDLRIAVVQSARDLFGEFSKQCYAASQAFESVGIYEEDFTDDSGIYQVNPGKEKLITYDTNPEDPVTLYLSTSAGTGYRPLTKTPMISKVSVTDNGETAVFVSNERRLRMINTNSSDISERIISGFSMYDRVAISKDGKRLAATKSIPDGSIFVVDLVSGEGRQFILYNPTTSDASINAGGVVKAYSLDFDISGEYLIYGAYNVINSNSQKDIYYWDIGIIKIWDILHQTFGNGIISKLYSTLPAHVNVANPVFAKNYPYIIAFDYFYDDGLLEEYGIYTANLETGEISRIATNDRLGYPSFSTRDDQIAYSTINGLNTQVVKSVKLTDDRLGTADEPGVLVPDAKWPVFFTTGERTLGLPPVSKFTTDFKYGNFPLNARFIDLSANQPQSWHWIFEGGSPAESIEQYPEVVFEKPGFYKITLITANSFGSDTLVKERYIHAIDPVAAQDQFTDKFIVWPNPTHVILNISSANENFLLTIFNTNGNKVLVTQNAHQIDVSELSPGLYILEVKSQTSLYRTKLMIE